MGRNRQWGWFGALSTGSSHRRSGTPRQDAAAISEYAVADEAYLVVAISDGAGSAAHSDRGATTTVLSAHRYARDFLSNGHSLGDLNDQTALGWLSGIRSSLKATGDRIGSNFSDLASTLTLAIFGNEHHAILQIGDSFCVIKTDNGWQLPVLPMRGEYANETTFVTRQPEPQFQLHVGKARIASICTFTDGLERLVIEKDPERPHSPFFEGLQATFDNQRKQGRNRTLSASMGAYLDGDDICNLTNDDKTLIFASRIGLHHSE